MKCKISEISLWTSGMNYASSAAVQKVHILCACMCMCVCLFVCVLGQIGQSRDEATPVVSCNDVTHTHD